MFPALATSAFIASALVLVPLPWHWRARNVATLSIIAWLFVLNVSYAVNALIWAGNVNIVVPVWCDIVTKIKIGATVALPSACLSLALQLHGIARSLKTPNRGRIGVLVDLALCWGLPSLIMALHYIVQGHRFDIVEDLGCRPAMYISVLSLLLVDLPPAFASCLALLYCGLAVFYFFRRRIAFAQTTNCAESVLNKSHYIRLMAMTTVLGTWNAIIISIGLWATYSAGFRPWTSWSDMHFDFSRIQPYLLADVPDNLLWLTYTLWAAIPISSVLFFSFFSFGGDAMKEYSYLLRWIRRKGFIRHSPSLEIHPEDASIHRVPTGIADVVGNRAINTTWGRSIAAWTPTQSLYAQPSCHESSPVATFTSADNLLPLRSGPLKEEDAGDEREEDVNEAQEFWAI
ncbi:Pheromone receptor [Mycena sanguinolenta]|uniref:Pheromone receptor n=1 Tax=Mycena sanguinolenta TaxID=230812 RepID=A0A8H7DJ18_9AGAR|nr:Pheromone receptor [Mycena sanguinolenta]